MKASGVGVEETFKTDKPRKEKKWVMSDFYIGLAHYVVDCTRSVFGLHRLLARPSFCSWYGHHGCFSGVKLNATKKECSTLFSGTKKIKGRHLIGPEKGHLQGMPRAGMASIKMSSPRRERWVSKGKESGR